MVAGRRWVTCDDGCRTAFSVPTCDALERCPVHGCPGGPWRVLTAVEVRFLEALAPWPLSMSDYRWLIANKIRPEPPTWSV